MEEEGSRRRAERRIRGIASKAILNEHCDKYSRGVQHFIKFFLGAPKLPQDYPPPPTPQELEALYYVDQRSQLITQQLDRLCASLADKPVAEREFFVSRTKQEIRKKIPMPTFHQAPKQTNLGGRRPISLLTKGDVERTLAVAGISRMTFDWGVAKDQESPWNSVVVEVMATKAVEWLSRTMKISEEDSSQAPAIIMRWLKSKSKELSQFGQMEVGE